MNLLNEAKTVIIYVSFLVLELAVIALGWYLLFRYYLIEKFDFAKELFGLKQPPVYEPSAQFTARKKEKERREKEREKEKDRLETKAEADGGNDGAVQTDVNRNVIKNFDVVGSGLDGGPGTRLGDYTSTETLPQSSVSGTKDKTD